MAFKSSSGGILGKPLAGCGSAQGIAWGDFGSCVRSRQGLLLALMKTYGHVTG